MLGRPNALTLTLHSGQWIALASIALSIEAGATRSSRASWEISKLVSHYQKSRGSRALSSIGIPLPEHESKCCPAHLRGRLTSVRIPLMVVSVTLSMESLAARVAEVAAPRPVALAYLFGSAATGLMTPFSDVDLALVLDQDHAFQDSRLQFELEIEDELAARGLSQADVRVINAAPLLLRGEVVTQGRLLFARNKDMRIEFETRTRMEYFDFLPAAEFYRKAFFENLRQRGLSGQRSKIAGSAR